MTKIQSEPDELHVARHKVSVGIRWARRRGDHGLAARLEHALQVLNSAVAGYARRHGKVTARVHFSARIAARRTRVGRWALH